MISISLVLHRIKTIGITASKMLKFCFPNIGKLWNNIKYRDDAEIIMQLSNSEGPYDLAICQKAPPNLLTDNGGTVLTQI